VKNDMSASQAAPSIDDSKVVSERLLGVALRQIGNRVVDPREAAGRVLAIMARRETIGAQTLRPSFFRHPV